MSHKDYLNDSKKASLSGKGAGLQGERAYVAGNERAPN